MFFCQVLSIWKSACTCYKTASSATKPLQDRRRLRTSPHLSPLVSQCLINTSTAGYPWHSRPLFICRFYTKETTRLSPKTLFHGWWESFFGFFYACHLSFVTEFASAVMVNENNSEYCWRASLIRLKNERDFNWYGSVLKQLNKITHFCQGHFPKVCKS